MIGWLQLGVVLEVLIVAGCALLAFLLGATAYVIAWCLTRIISAAAAEWSEVGAQRRTSGEAPPC